MKNYYLKSFLCCVLESILAFFLFVSPVFALRTIHETGVSLENDKIEFTGAYPGGQFGAEIAAADFNNDGLGDLLISSPFVSYGDRQWNGMVKLIFGRSAGVESSEKSPDISFFGQDTGDQLGTALAVGDYNHDGFMDFAMSALRASFEGKHTGKVYVINGRPLEAFKQVAVEYDLSVYGADGVFSGYREGDGFGFSLATAEINHDDMNDLLVGAPFSDTLNFEKAGNVYGYFGSIRGLPFEQNVLFRGNQTLERFGASLAAGDLNADGKSDVLIGAYSSPNGSVKQAGKVYFYDGTARFPRLVDNESIALKGQSEKQWLGFDMDTGDVNGDSIEDVAVSSFSYVGEREKAKVEVYFGGEKFVPYQQSKIDPDVIIKDPLDEALLGASVLIDDLDGDDRGDIIVGAPGVASVMSTIPGDVYVVYGDVVGHENEFSVRDNGVHSIIHGENADDWFGYSTAVMDYDSDGFKDLVIGSRYSEGDLGVNNGKVFVLRGNGAVFGSERPVMDGEVETVTRGEIVSVVLDSFDLQKKKTDQLKQCYDFIDFCLFNFMAMSSFDGISLLEPLILYPDVQPTTRYREAINTATLLGIVNGYMEEYYSPFKPDNPVNRIQALKIILAATELVPVKYRFELVEELGSEESLAGQPSYFTDVDSEISYMWWYPRYVNFAVDNDIIEDGEFFRPHDPVTAGELRQMIDKTLGLLEILNSSDEKVAS